MSEVGKQLISALGNAKYDANAASDRPHDESCWALMPDFDWRDCNCSRPVSR